MYNQVDYLQHIAKGHILYMLFKFQLSVFQKSAVSQIPLIIYLASKLFTITFMSQICHSHSTLLCGKFT